MIERTSLDVYFNTVKPTIKKRHNRTLEGIRKYPDHTTAELSKILHIPIQSIAGRPGELAIKGRAKRVEQRVCSVTHNEAWTWRVI